MLKTDPRMPDNAVNAEFLLDRNWIAGDPDEYARKICELYAKVGGLGHLLMFRALQVMREAGSRTAWFLWSDDATAARLYHAAGFKERRRFALLRKELGR